MCKSTCNTCCEDIEYTAAITVYTWRRVRYVIHRRSYIPQRCQLIGRFRDRLQFLAIKDLYSQIPGDLVDKKDEKAVAQFMVEDLCHIDVQMTMDAPDHPDGSISHGGYCLNYSKQYTLEKIPKHLPSHLRNASVVSFKCSQYRYHPSETSKYPNELDKQRHHEAMSTYDCNGMINVYFPPKPQRTFNHCNEAMDAMITADMELDQGKSSSWILRSKRMNDLHPYGRN